jgi:hypothetical protein
MFVSSFWQLAMSDDFLTVIFVSYFCTVVFFSVAMK